MVVTQLVLMLVVLVVVALVLIDQVLHYSQHKPMQLLLALVVLVTHIQVTQLATKAMILLLLVLPLKAAEVVVLMDIQ